MLCRYPDCDCGVQGCGQHVDPSEHAELVKRERLTAAAPEMLAALKGCLRALNTALERSDNDVFGIGHNDAMDAMDAAERIIAAVERAP